MAKATRKTRSLDDEFDEIIETAITAADHVKCSLEDCGAGFRSMREALNIRIYAIEQELRVAAREKDK